jgi:ubiquinone/menaquinone biosynthesis C-methylase UbiE
LSHLSSLSTDDKWDVNLELLKNFIIENIKTPSTHSENIDEKCLGQWFVTQNANYKNRTMGMKLDAKYNIWTSFIKEYEILSNDDKWSINFELLKKFISERNKTPSHGSRNNDEKNLGSWFSKQNSNYKNRTQGMTDETRYSIWKIFTEEFLTKIQIKPIKSMGLKNTTKKTEEIVKETTEQKKQRTKSQMEILHQRYKTLSSTSLNKIFSDDSDLWNEYHKLSEKNEESFPQEGIPRNRIIEELEKQKTKRTKTVVDMGCGRAQISKHFIDKKDTRFQFINYDHVSSDETVIACDISKVPLEDNSVEIAILSLAMWGSNCESYISEAHRILESNGLLYIMEATKRWSEKDENHNLIEGEEGGKLKKKLEENGFQITSSKIEKFSMFICIKK